MDSIENSHDSIYQEFLQMKILFFALEPPYPPNDGGRIRTFNILRAIAQRHDVTLIAFDRPDLNSSDIIELKVFCSSMIVVKRPEISPIGWLGKAIHVFNRYPRSLDFFASSEMHNTLKELISLGNYDVAHVDQIYLAQYIESISPLPAVLTHHNIESMIKEQWLDARKDRYSIGWWRNQLENHRWKRYEIELSRRFDSLVTVSEQDALYFKKHAPKIPVRVVPNGVDTEYFKTKTKSQPGKNLLFTGRMDYPPNIDAMVWFCQDIFPILKESQPDVTLKIVGRNPTPDIKSLEIISGVEVVGGVPDVRPFYENAMVFVVPLRFGGGTRLKILEALAMEIPVFSTSLGCEGLGLIDHQEIVIVDDESKFINQLDIFLRKKNMRLKLSASGRKIVESKYDWKAIIYQQEKAYLDAMVKRV